MRFRRRLILLYLVFCGGLGLVWLRASQLQILDGDAWAEAARKQRQHTGRLDALRGPIISADGVVLAEDVPVFQLTVVPWDWTHRTRARCTACGAIYFPRRSGRLPRTCPCERLLERGANPSGRDAYPRGAEPGAGRLEKLAPADLRPLEKALHLEPGTLAGKAAARLEDIEDLVKATREFLTGDGDEPAFLKQRLVMRRLDLMKRPFVIVADVDEDAVRLVQTNEMGRYRGFGIQVALRRRYPLGDLAPQLLGYTAKIVSDAEYQALKERHGPRITHSTRIGRRGLERAYNWRLHGQPGRRVMELGPDGSFSEIVSDEPPQQGRPLRLSLDAQVSRDAERLLEKHAPEAGYAPGGLASGGFVLLDTDTGEILVWGEAPRFNLNSDLDKIYDPKRVRAKADRDEGVWVPTHGLPPGMALETWLHELVQPAPITMSRVGGVAVETGSTFKPLIGLALLSSGLPLPFGEFVCSRHGRGFPGCHGCGSVGLEMAITKSCNRYFAFSLRDSRHWKTYRYFVADFIGELGIGLPPGSEMAEWSRGQWLQPDAYDFPLEVALKNATERLERQAAAAARKAAEAATKGNSASKRGIVVAPELLLSLQPKAPGRVGGDPRGLGRTLAGVASWVSQKSGADRVAVNVSTERVEGSRILVKFGLRAARRPAWFSLPAIEEGASRLPPILRGRDAWRAGVSGRVERGGTVWFIATFDRRMGRDSPASRLVIRPDDGRNAAIGQGPVLATPLQMARAMAVLANGGTLVDPHVVPDLGAGRRFRDARKLRVDPAHLGRIRRGMYGVANMTEGTADSHCNWAAVPADVYSKTGTAQVGGPWRPFGETVDHGPWHHWFVGYAEAPGRRTVAFACVLHARTEKAAGMTAAPAVQEILQHWYRSPLSRSAPE